MLTLAKRNLLLSLSTPLVMDAVCGLGLEERMVDFGIRPLLPFSRMVGTAVTVRLRSQPDPSKADLEPYAQLISTGAGRYCPVLVAEVPKEHHNRGVFGEGSVTMGQHCGLAGALIEGAVRDTHDLRRLGFPVFSRAVSPGHIVHKVEVAEIGGPVHIGALTVEQDQIVFGDNDGAIVIDACDLDRILERSVEIQKWEEKTHRRLAEGASYQDTMNEMGTMPKR